MGILRIISFEGRKMGGELGLLLGGVVGRYWEESWTTGSMPANEVSLGQLGVV